MSSRVALAAKVSASSFIISYTHGLINYMDSGHLSNISSSKKFVVAGFVVPCAPAVAGTSAIVTSINYKMFNTCYPLIVGNGYNLFSLLRNRIVNSYSNVR
jgi:hypothetical protein